MLSGGSTVNFQVGFDSGGNSQISFTGVEGTLSSLGLNTDNSSNFIGYSLNIAAGALAALDAVKAAASTLTTNRGTIGSAQSRLSVSINNLQIARENFQSAESRIRDVDVAEESANLTRLSILQQSGSAILAQANQQPAIALSLLGR